MRLCTLVVGRLKVTWKRDGQTRIRRRTRRRVGVDRHGVLRVRRSRRQDAGLYTCKATATTNHRRRLQSTANTTVHFHRPQDALQLIQARWMNILNDAVDVDILLGSAVMRLGPLSYRRSIHGPPESYSVTYIRHRLVRIINLHLRPYVLTYLAYRGAVLELLGSKSVRSGFSGRLGDV